MTERTQKFILSAVGVLIISILVGYLVFAWTEPPYGGTCTNPPCPPGGNVPAPINVGPQGQAKEGGLILNTGNATTGLIVQYGNVGIGTTAPGAKLYVKTTDLTTVPFQVEALVFPLSGWSYRRPITISNTGGGLNDYQVLVTLNTATLISAGKMRSDCGDIRFTDSNGSTLLNYWLESGCNSASTKIWVKVPSIPASSSKKIYVYYGNPSATSQSNGDATFDFFDDFNDGNISDWSMGGAGDNPNSGSISVQSDYYISPPYSMQTYAYDQCLSGSVWWTETWAYKSISIPAGSYKIDFYNRLYGYFSYYTTGYFAARIYIDSTKIYERMTSRSGSGYVTLEWLKDSANLTISSSPITLKLTSYAADCCWTKVWWDDVRIRKYTSPEPTTSVGAEETVPPPPQQTVFYIQNETGNVGIGTTAPLEKLDVTGNINLSGERAKITASKPDTITLVGQCFILGLRGCQCQDAPPCPSGCVEISQQRANCVQVSFLRPCEWSSGNQCVQYRICECARVFYPINISDTLVIQPNNGNVGIGTTNPTRKLEVNGKTNIANPLFPWSKKDCPGWDEVGETCSLDLDTNYSAAIVAVTPDFVSDVIWIGFYDASDRQIGIIKVPVAAEAGWGIFYYSGAHATVFLPTTASYAKIVGKGGAYGNRSYDDNIIIMGYFR